MEVNYCYACGASIQKQHVFCSKCGTNQGMGGAVRNEKVECCSNAEIKIIKKSPNCIIYWAFSPLVTLFIVAAYSSVVRYPRDSVVALLIVSTLLANLLFYKSNYFLNSKLYEILKLQKFSKVYLHAFIMLLIAIPASLFGDFVAIVVFGYDGYGDFLPFISLWASFLISYCGYFLYNIGKNKIDIFFILTSCLIFSLFYSSAGLFLGDGFKSIFIYPQLLLALFVSIKLMEYFNKKAESV